MKNTTESFDNVLKLTAKQKFVTTVVSRVMMERLTVCCVNYQ